MESGGGVKLANHQSSIINHQSKAFSLVEVLAALAVMGIALVGLMRLHLISVAAADKAEAVTQATLLAEGQLDALVAGNLSSPLSGTEVRDGRSFHWQARVTQERPPELTVGRAPRRVTMQVWWDQGLGRKEVELDTFLPRERTL